jgi:hypothetical protein
MEHPAAKYRSRTFSNLYNWCSVGDLVDLAKNATFSRRTDLDPLDITTYAGRPTDEPVLESFNPARIFMYADIGRLAAVGNVGWRELGK